MMTNGIDPIIPLTLSNIPNVGKKTLKFALDEFQKDIDNSKEKFIFIRDFLNKNSDSLKKINFRFAVPNDNELNLAYDKAKNVLLESNRANIEIIPRDSTNFPEKLKQIPDPPLILFAKGNISLINQSKAIGIVGTRNPSDYGVTTAEKLGEISAKNHFVVVSGLAEGCDAAAHEGCLNENGQTIAVLAHGLQMIYPRQNANLAERILDSNGCLLSEYAYGVRPSRFSFIDRDRLQSGLSCGIVVVETDIKGGTMHTVDFCLKQKRKLACVQHPDNHLLLSQARGNQLLIKEKNAIPVNVDDKDSISNLFREMQSTSFSKNDEVLIPKPTSPTRSLEKNPELNEFIVPVFSQKERILKSTPKKRGQISLGDFKNENPG
ncbi:MAG: DNA-processing protein DprA [Methanoregula sp.]|jgi:DNA processing protein